MPPLSDFEKSGNASTLSMLYHNQVCISIIYEITVIITLINVSLSLPCTLKHSYLDRETSLILKNIAGKPSHLLTKVTPLFACLFSVFCMFRFILVLHGKPFNLSLISRLDTLLHPHCLLTFLKRYISCLLFAAIFICVQFCHAI